MGGVDGAHALWMRSTRASGWRGGTGWGPGWTMSTLTCRSVAIRGAHSFGFAIYSAAHDRYQDAVLRIATTTWRGSVNGPLPCAVSILSTISTSHSW
jgi:hypothetical protein